MNLEKLYENVKVAEQAMKQAEYGPDLTAEDLFPDKGEPVYEPSRQAIGVVDSMLGELMLWNGFYRWWEDLGQSSRHAVTERLRIAYDDWNEER